MLAAFALVCSRCGNLRSVCSDPDRVWHVNEATCYVTATEEWGFRRLRQQYKDERPDEGQLHSLDGATVWVSDIDLESGSAD